MADQNGPITFNSRSKAPYDQFSNFYEAKIKMPEGVFASVEHYFHAMKFIDEDHPRFEIHGDLGEQSHESGSWKPSVSKGRFIKSAGGKVGTKKYALTLRTGGLERMWAKQKMKEGLRKKFEAEPFRELLLKTGRRMLVHTPMRGKTDFWSGRVDKKDGEKMIGENNMGKLLMEVREELKMKYEADVGVEKNTADIVSQKSLEEKSEKKKDGMKHKKVGEKSKESLESEADVGVEENTADIVSQKSLEKKSKKRKHVEDSDSKGPNVKRNKVEKTPKDSKESKVEEKKSGEGKNTGGPSGDNIQSKKRNRVGIKRDGEISTCVAKGSVGIMGGKRRREKDEKGDSECEGPEIKRSKIENESKEDFEDTEDGDNKSDGEAKDSDDVNTQDTKK